MHSQPAFDDSSRMAMAFGKLCVLRWRIHALEEMEANTILPIVLAGPEHVSKCAPLRSCHPEGLQSA